MPTLAELAQDTLDWLERREAGGLLPDTHHQNFKDRLAWVLWVASQETHANADVADAVRELRALFHLGAGDEDVTWKQFLDSITTGGPPDATRRFLFNVNYMDGWRPERPPIVEADAKRKLQRVRRALKLIATAVGSGAALEQEPADPAERLAAIGPGGTPAARLDTRAGADAVSEELANAIEPTKSELSPSRVKARAVYEWAIQTIEGADKMPLRNLLPRILKELDSKIATAPPGAGEVEKLQELRDSLPGSAETFGKYLREAGIKRYNTKGERIRKISHFPRRDQI